VLTNPTQCWVESHDVRTSVFPLIHDCAAGVNLKLLSESKDCLAERC
jgi:hypothetical protein